MTIGCTCETPGCGGIAHAPGGPRPDGESDAMPPGAARALRQGAHTILTSRDITLDEAPGGRPRRPKEAGS